MAVLVHLANHPGQVVTRQELLEEVWAGTNVVEAVLTRAVSLLRRAFGDEPGAPCRIETIPKKGYRLVGPVERERSPATRSGPRTVAVLPFQILSGERDQEYLADGFTELTITGRRGEAVAEMEVGRALGPYDVGLNMNLGDHLIFARRWEAGIAQHRRTVEMEPGFRRGHLRLARACAQAGRMAEASAALEAATALAGPVGPGADEAYVLARLGRNGEARELLGRLGDRFDLVRTQAWEVAQVHVALGDAEDAFTWIDRAIEEGHGQVVFLDAEPAFDPIRGDARLDRLRHRLGLPAPA
jgi:predicted Zn-dependent protease